MGFNYQVSNFKRWRFFLLSSFLFPLSFLIACQQKTTTTLTPQILNTYPHDNQAFTQGLVLHEGKF